jgi:phage terminase small subunit
MPRGRPKAQLIPERPHLVPVTSVDLPVPPEHLSPDMKAWWQGVVTAYDLGDHHLLTLEAACNAWDRMTTARQAIEQFGLTFTDERGMVRSRPEVSIERDARVAFLRCVRELDLDLEPPPPLNRPPALRSNRR